MNATILRLLRSPLHRVIGGRICGLRFRGRVTGRIVQLPVEYARIGRQLVVLAGRGERKTWWRNFRTPHRLDVLLEGRWHVATGVAVLAGNPGRAAALAAYRLAHARVPDDTSDPVVVIDLDYALPDRGRQLWLRWFRNVTVGECAGFAVPATVGALTAAAIPVISMPLLVLAGATEGALLGWFQARVLRDVVPGLSVARWTAATAAAAALAWAIGLVPGLVGDRLSGLPPALLVAIGVPGALVLLLSIGTAQWTVLRRLLPDTGRWVWGTTLAWLAALGAFFAIATPLWRPGQSVAAVVMVGVLAGLLMAVTVAALTGILVVRVVHADDDIQSEKPGSR